MYQLCETLELRLQKYTMTKIVDFKKANDKQLIIQVRNACVRLKYCIAAQHIITPLKQRLGRTGRKKCNI
jgi:hypothetical protein